jgi:peptidoglycan/xylan/chitin deacetylase (PgdA/CDA1 family)
METSLRVPALEEIKGPEPIEVATWQPSHATLWVHAPLLSPAMLARFPHPVKAVAAAADVLRRPPGGLVVLIYHRVGRGAAIETDLPMSLFEDQINFLANQADVVALDEGLHAVRSRSSTASSMVAITFDDGTADFAELALPVLARHHVPVTLYLATAFIDDNRPFPHDGVPISWDALRDACSTGLVSVGSHTHRHALLDRLPPKEVDDELDRSIGLIGERIGVTAEDFAYPKGLLGSPQAQRAIRSRFRSAALAGTRPNRFGATDPYRVARSPIQVSDGMRWFARKARGGLALEDRIRGAMNRRRYRDATT